MANDQLQPGETETPIQTAPSSNAGLLPGEIESPISTAQAAAIPASLQDAYARGQHAPIPDADPTSYLQDRVQQIKDQATGVAKGAAETVHTVGTFLHDHLGVPMPDEVLHPELEGGTEAKNTNESVGKFGEAIGEFMLGDEAIKGLGIADRLGATQKVMKIAEQHPIIAKALVVGMNALRNGAVGGGEALTKGATPTEALESGATTAAGGALLDTAGEVIPKIPGALRQIWNGADVAQAPAQDALRAGVQAGAETAGIADESGAANIQNQGLRAVLDEPIARLQDAKKAVYSSVDQAAGTDLKTLYSKLDAINDKIDLEPSGSPEEARLEVQRISQMQTIEDAKQAARNKNVDADDLLEKGDAMHTQEMALRDLQKKVFNNQSVVAGNVSHGAPESIDVDATIKSLERLNQATKYGPNRLAQALGRDGATKLMDDMYAAQRLGVKALKTQNVAKWIGAIAAGAVGVGAATKGISAGVQAISGK